MPKKWKFTPAQEGHIRDLYLQGQPAYKISRDYDVNFKAIQRVLEEAGVYEHGRRFRGRLSPEQKTEMAERYAAGESQVSLAKDFGCSASNIGLTLRRMGISTRSHRVILMDPESEETIRMLRADGLPFSVIAARMGIPPHRVQRWARDMGISDYIAKRGADNPAWVGGRVKHAQGYWYVYVNDDDPLVSMRLRYNNYAAEHRIVMARSLGRPLAKNETVHHINGDRADNRLENLQLRSGNHGNGVVMQCLDCGSRNVGPVPIAD